MSIAAVKMINNTLPMTATPVTLARLARIAEPTCAPPMYAMPQAGDQQVRSLVERGFADVVERAVHRDKRLHPRPQGDDQTDDEHDRVAVQFRWVILDLLADEWKLVQRRIDDVLPQRRIAFEDETEHRGEHHEQWKDRQKRIVGDEGCVATAAVLAESFGHAHRKIGSPGSCT